MLWLLHKSGHMSKESEPYFLKLRQSETSLPTEVGNVPRDPVVRGKASYSLYSVSDIGHQSLILLPKRLKSMTIMKYMQLFSNSSMYLIDDSNIMS